LESSLEPPVKPPDISIRIISDDKMEDKVFVKVPIP
jgi:hypothetical protein